MFTSNIPLQHIILDYIIIILDYIIIIWIILYWIYYICNTGFSSWPCDFIYYKAEQKDLKIHNINTQFLDNYRTCLRQTLTNSGVVVGR